VPVAALSSEPLRIPEAVHLDALVSELRARGYQMAVVVDEYGGTAGIVSLVATSNHGMDTDADEFDREAPPVEEVDLRTRRVTAGLPVDDLEELYGVELPHEDVETVGGLLASALGLMLGVAASTLSAALTYGPNHAGDWISPEVMVGLGLAVAALALLLGRSARSCLVAALVLLVWQLALLNQAPADVYFAQTLQNWEQGRFIRFHGLIQWLGWLWPYAVLWHLVRRLSATSARA